MEEASVPMMFRSQFRPEHSEAIHPSRLATASEKPFEDEAVSDTFTISGLPQSYDKELTVSLTYTGELTDNSYIAVGVNTWVSSYGEMAMTYTMLPATADGTQLTAVLPATGNEIAKAVTTNSDEPVKLTVTAVTSYKPHVTAEGTFRNRVCITVDNTRIGTATRTVP